MAKSYDAERPSSMQNISRYRLPILGVTISPMTMDKAISIADEAISRNAKRCFAFSTAHMLVEAHDNGELRDALNGSHVIVTTDGMPVVWLSRLKGARAIERVYGPDALLEFCRVGLSRGWRHYFYGATEETLARLVSNLCQRCPGLVVAGTYSPPFRTLTDAELQDVSERINATKPHLIWVGLGMPKQELWMHRACDMLDAPVILAVGAAFDFHSGVVKQAPRWMQRSGLEWLFRLTQEPGRLWRRYLYTNTRFLWLVARESVMNAMPPNSR